MANTDIALPPPPGRSLMHLDARNGAVADYDLVETRPGVDFSALRSILWRERWLILAILLLALAAGIASIVFTPKTYEARAVIQIDPQAPKVLGTEADESIPRTEADRALQTQVDALRSRALADAVVRDLSLDRNDGFLRRAGVEEDATPAERTQAAIQEVQDSTAISSPQESRIISVAFSSGDPTVSAAVANSLVEHAIDANLQRRVAASDYSKAFLDKQIGVTKARLEQSERALIAYSRAANYVDASGAAGVSDQNNAGRSLTTANLVDLNDSYAQARSNRLQAQQRWQQAQATPVMSLPEVLANPAIQELTRSRAELDSALQEQKQRYKEGHPSMQQATAKLSEMDRQISTLAGSIRNSINDQYRVAARQESAISGSLAQLKSATLTEQEKGVRYNMLKREVDTNRDLFNNLLRRFNEISSEAGLNSNNISIVDRAFAPADPVSPRPAVNMILAGFGGLSLALALAFTRQRMTDAVNDPVEVERDLGLPLLGLVPVVKGHETVTHALDNPRSPINEAHHSICASLDNRANLTNSAILMITSSRQEEGKSTSALKLASNIASSGRRVLLIDGDMRRGSLHRLIGARNDMGLATILRTGMDFDRAVQATETPNLHFVPRGRPADNPAGLLASATMLQFLHAMKERYDAIIVDGPPVLGLADAPRLAAAADATVFVMQAHSARKQEAKLALRRLLAAGANVVGIVMTKFDPDKAGGRYAYAYTYDYGDEFDDEPETSSVAA